MSVSFKGRFPALVTNTDMVYLDSASTTQKPQIVIDAVRGLYEDGIANPHRGLYDLSLRLTDQFEGVRAKVAQFIGAHSPNEIVFTSGTTQSINLVAATWGRTNLQAGDIIVLSDMEHHSNLLPWMRLRDEIGVELVYIPLNADFQLEYTSLAIDFSKVKLLALTHASNVLGTVNPISNIAQYFRGKNSEIRVLVDAAQTASHIPLNVDELGADFLAFSSHKMFGPSGIGILYARAELLNKMTPYQLGGQMISSVSKEKVVWAEPPHKFEAGSQNIEGVIGLGAAIDFIQSVGFDQIMQHDRELVQYGLEALRDVDLYGPKTTDDRLAVFSFNVPGVHAHDTAEILNRSHIAARAGHHCAEPLMRCLGTNGTVRASLHIYNEKDDLDALRKSLEEVKKVMHA